MDTLTPRTTPHPTVTALRGAVLVMEAAESAGLPIPTYVTTSSYAAVAFGADETTVSWLPATLADLRAWSVYLDQPIQDRSDDSGETFHYLDTTLFEQSVSLCVIEDAPVAAVTL